MTAATSDLKAENLPPRIWRRVGEACVKRAALSHGARLQSRVCVKVTAGPLQPRQNQRIKQTGVGLGRQVCAQSAPG